MRQHGPSDRQPAGHGDLRAVQDHPVRVPQRRANQSDRQCRVEQDEIGAYLVGERVDAPRDPRLGQQHRLARAHDAERLLAIEIVGAAM